MTFTTSLKEEISQINLNMQESRIELESFIKFCGKVDKVITLTLENGAVARKIYKDIKNDEFEKKLLDKLNELCLSTSYLLRNTALIYIKFYIEKLDDELFLDFFEKKLIKIVINLSYI